MTFLYLHDVFYTFAASDKFFKFCSSLFHCCIYSIEIEIALNRNISNKIHVRKSNFSNVIKIDLIISN